VSETSEPAHNLERRFLLDFVVGESSTILEPLTSISQALLIGRDAWGARYQQQERVSAHSYEWSGAQEHKSTRAQEHKHTSSAMVGSAMSMREAATHTNLLCLGPFA